ncbi:protein FAM168A-like [Salvelinus namaycush]|uniref:Protein FAM168A-like n=1 Tax=Salvelinus namaycush TaxID=8040 RepID=A0A8U0TVR4_SALNM|nr:protein FAM168A-like [Salvelinus namaycush]
MLQMVRTLAQFSIALDEMQENGVNTSEEGRQEREEGGGEELMDRDAADRHGNTNGNGSGSANGNGNMANGNGLGAVSPQNRGEVDQCVCLKGYTTAGTPYKVPPTQMNGAPPPYSPSPNPYQTAMYPIRSAYPQQSMQNLQNLYAQAYYTQPVYAAQPQPHVIHHTTVVQPNSLPSALYPAPVQAPRNNGMAAMGMVAGTTMAMSAGTLLTTPQHAQLGTHQHVTMPQYRPQGTPGYSYVPPHW